MNTVADSTLHDEATREALLQQEIFAALDGVRREACYSERAVALHLGVAFDMQRSLLRATRRVAQTICAYEGEVYALAIQDMHGRAFGRVGQVQVVEFHTCLILPVEHKLSVATRAAQGVGNLTDIGIEQEALRDGYLRAADCGVHVGRYIARHEDLG